MLNLRDPTLLTNNRASAAAYLTVAFPEVRITTVEPYYGTGVSWTEEYDSRWFHLSNSNEGEGRTSHSRSGWSPFAILETGIRTD